MQHAAYSIQHVADSARHMASLIVDFLDDLLQRSVAVALEHLASFAYSFSAMAFSSIPYYAVLSYTFSAIEDAMISGG